MDVPTSPHVGLQALSFSRYKVNSLGFAYQPQGQTFQETPQTLAESRLRFCYTSDPTHPIIGSLAYRGTGTISYQVLTETPTSVQFAEWNSWKLECKVPQPEWLYLNFPRFTPQALDITPGGIALQRETYFGTCTLLDSYTNDVSDPTDRVLMPHGQLWMTGEFEFSDPSPLLYTYIPPQLRTLALDAAQVIQSELKEESKEEKKAPTLPDIEDLDIVSPPSFKATPSRVPGGIMYSPRVRVPSKKGS
jgi:hypothetical protein